MTDKKTEALKLALEALKQIDEAMPFPVAKLAQKVIREALADIALDKMAENARELRLDYEPPCKTGSQCTNKCQQCELPANQLDDIYVVDIPAQQPYGWKVYGVNSLFTGKFAEEDAKAEAKRIGGTCIAFPLYTSPPASKPWVGLTDEEIQNLWNQHEPWFDYYLFSCAIEAKLEEKNNG